MPTIDSPQRFPKEAPRFAIIFSLRLESVVLGLNFDDADGSFPISFPLSLRPIDRFRDFMELRSFERVWL
jgi:hypothetical protein